MYRFPLLTLYLFYSFLCSQGWTSSIEDEEHKQIPVQSKAEKIEFVDEKAIWGIAEEQLDELFEHSSDLVCLAGTQYFSRVNAVWTKVLGWSEQELLAQPYKNIVHPEDIPSTKIVAHQSTYNSIVHNAEADLNILKDQLSNRPMTIDFENRYQTKQGEYCILQWLILSQVCGPKTQSPILALGKNITLQKQAQQQKVALQQAQVATKMKSTFVAHMSHEIRTPLNGILGFIELALEEQVSDKVQTYLHHAHESALLLLEIANDIIDVSRIEAGAMKIDKIDFNPIDALQNVLGVLNLQAEKKNLKLTTVVSKSLPEVLIGDPIRFKQILLNLGSNALKFTTHGKVALKIEGQEVPNQPHLYLLQGKVKDSGIGMEASFLQQLFQPFSQEHRSTTPQFSGAGLGLFITKQLCEKMGGSIQVISTPGLGSTFQFQILLEKSEVSSPNLSKSRRFHSSVRLPVKQILVVDDNRMNQKVFTEMLTPLGGQIDIAENGAQALKLIQDKTYELILMDGEMPVMDGLEATQKIRQQFSQDQLPIIGVTAHALTHHRSEFLAAGMNGYLTKPVQRAQLLEEIYRCCPKKPNL